jgi:SAM-dependent methyltransferase
VLRRILFVSCFVALAGAAAMFLMGRGSHPLKDPSPGSRSAPLHSPDYIYGAAVEPYTASYVRPVVMSYLADVPAGASVLDLGCGTGALLASMHDRQWRRTGVDLSAQGIQIARQTHPDITFIEADATGDLKSLIGEGTFDIVVSTETLEHVTLPRLFVQNAYQALKPGGRLVLSVPYNGYLKYLAIAALGRTDGYFDPLWDWGHIKFFTVDSMANLLWDSGFERLEYQGAGRVPYLWKSMVFVAYKPVAAPGN